MKVIEATATGPELVEAVARLIPQLSSTSSPPAADELAKLVTSESSRLLLAFDDEQLVGMLTLVIYRAPTGLRARIEDVVVDRAARGKGIGAALSSKALALATESEVRTVDLASRPDRRAANHMYQRLGFEVRQSNTYRYTITG
jgi:ribosomal protein S18 acetylase RimI-like enzyme